jgi:hypothetical protein
MCDPWGYILAAVTSAVIATLTTILWRWRS